MLKQVAILLIGILIGANAVYFLMSREQARGDAPETAASAEPTQDTARVPSPGRGAMDPQAPLPQSPALPRLPTGEGIGRLVVPVRGVTPAQLSDTFDDARGSERRHEALDIMAPTGTPVVAVADGTIEKLFDSVQGGLTIYQFDPDRRYAYYYAHLDRYADGLAEQQVVRQGQVLGHVGSSGNADAAAPHLHFAIFALTPERQWSKGTPVNPYPLLVRGAAAP
jgi:peptidoglycan LD-endopeptidase LytH